MNSTPRPETTGDRRRRTGIDSRVALALAAVGGVLLVAVAATRWGDAGTVGAWTAAVSALTGGAGLAARDEDGDAIERLTAKINRARAGEDVSFATDREDEVGDLYAAVGRLAAAAGHGDETGAGRARGEDATAPGDAGPSDSERSLRRYRSLVDAMHDPACIYDAEGRYEFVNEALADVYDTTPGALRGRPSPLVEAVRERGSTDRYRELVAGDRETLTGEYETDSVGRGQVVMEYRLSRLSIDGEFDGVVAVSREVTERRARERQLRERERDLAEYREFTDDVLDAIDDVFYLLDADGRLRRWNESLPAVTGYDEAELAGRHATEFLPPEARSKVSAALEEIAATGHTVFEAPVVTKDGDVLQFEFAAARVRDPDGKECIAGIGRDVSERRARERELERTRDMLEQSQRLASVGAWEMTVHADDPAALDDWDAVVDAVSLTATDETHRIFGVPLDRDLSLGTGLERFHPEDREEVRSALVRSVTDGRPFEFEARLLGDWEGVRWVRSIGEPVTADAGTGDERADATDTDERAGAVDGDGDRVVAVRGSIQDITESKTFERQVVERERDLAEYTEFTDDVLDALDDVFYVIDEDGHLQRWNETLPAVTGYDDATLAGMDGADFFGEDRAPEVVAAIEDVFETGHARVELPLLTSDGDAVPYEFVATRLEDPDGDPVLAGIGRDVSERRARERELAETKRRLEIALEGTNTGIFNWNLDTDAVAWDETAERILGLDPGEFGGTFDAFEELAHPEDLLRVKESAREAIERDELYQAEFRMEHADGSWVWVEARGHIVTDDDGTRRMVGINHDVTDRKEHELAMESLHETARGLLGTESRDEAAALVLGAAEELLDPVCAGVYLLEDGSNRLEPVATTSGFGAYCREDPVVAGDDSLVWNCYLTGTPSVVDAGTDSGDRQPFGEGVGGVVLPLGDHGVFVVGTTAATVDEESRRLVETLAATAEAAFDRIETETALRERDVELAARNRRLQRQVAITEVIRRVDRSLVGASSREEIEAAVCDRLAGTDDVAFAWIGGLGAADERLDPRAWAGAGEGYLDAVDLTVGPAAGRADSPGEAGAGDDGASGSAADALEPAVRVVGTREPAVVGNVVDQLQTGSWAKSALACDLHSVVAVPLVYEGYFYGVLGVYASEPDAFGDLERTVFAELGESIAHSINAVETQRALHADALVELRLRVPDADDLFGRLARETGGRVAFEGLASHSESESRLFVSASGVDAAAVAAVLDDRVSVREFRLVDDDGERALFEVVVEGETIPSRLVRHGASPRSLVATGADLEAVVDVPTATDVREFLEMLRAVAPDVELTGRRTVERAPHTRVELAESFLDALTDRQLEVLRTAYFAGFFDWPRTSTGEDVAAMLGVTQPTVNRHLRLAQRRLFAQLFGDESVDAPDPIDAE